MSLESALLAAAARSARKALESPMKPRGWALEGSLALEPRREGLWHATLDPANPLRLRHLATGRCLCPAYREMDTDLASVPRVLQLAGKAAKALHLAPDSFPKSAVMHDSGYDAGWFWVVSFGGARRARVTRAQVDAILYLCLGCEGATVADGISYWNGVRLGGASHWRAARAKPEAWPELFGGSAPAAVREIVPDRFPEVRDGQKGADEPDHRAHNQPCGQAKPGPVFPVQQESDSAKHGQQQ